MNLLTSYFIDQDQRRTQELTDCHTKNLLVFDKVINLKGRPTFNDFFKVTHRFPDTINIIANSDIVFPQSSLDIIKEYYSNKENSKRCMALSRWDCNEKEELRHHETWDSQDAWVFSGGIPTIKGADFVLGIPGSDNKIALLLKEAGFEVINPSKTVQCIHHHLYGQRTYTVEDRLPPPYNLITPTFL